MLVKVMLAEYGNNHAMIVNTGLEDETLARQVAIDTAKAKCEANNAHEWAYYQPDDIWVLKHPDTAIEAAVDDEHSPRMWATIIESGEFWDIDDD